MLVRVAAFRSAAALVAAGAPSAPAEVWVREGSASPPAFQPLLDHHLVHLEPAWTMGRLAAARVPQTRIEWQAWLDDLEQRGEVAFRSQHVVDGGGQGRILSRELLLGQNKGLTVGGIIPPLIAHGLTHRLGCLALPSAAQVLATRGDIEHVSFNLSGLVLDDPSFPARVRACLAEKGVDPRQIGFELIETGPPPNPWIGRQVVAELKEDGHRIYIDDVGQGRSLGHFVWLPPELIDVIKIDAAYVGVATRKPTVFADIRRLIDTAHSYGIQVVAEGVEDQETAWAMAAAGVDYQQGFFWHRPEPLLL